MNTKGFSILVTTILILSGYTSLSNAEEIFLCLSPTDQYVVAVEQEGDCREDEKEMTFRGRKMAELKSLTPVALFENNDKCDTEGTVTKIGFDKNGNNILDEDEVRFMNETCTIPVDEESGG